MSFMKVKIHLVNDYKNFDLSLPELALAGDSIKELDIPPDTVIITRNGQPIPLDSELSDGDELAVIRVLSGG